MKSKPASAKKISSASIRDERINESGSREINTASPSIIFTVEELHTMLKDRYKESQGNIDRFNARKSVSEIISLLRKYYENFSPIPVINPDGRRLFIYPCKQRNTSKSSACDSYSITNRTHDHHLYCLKCRPAEYSDTKNLKRRKTYELMTRRRPIKCMTPEELELEFEKERYRNKLNTKKVERISEKFNSLRNDITFEDGSSSRKQLQNALSYVKDNWTECRSYIIEELLDLQVEGDGSQQVSDEEKSKVINIIGEQFDNMSRNLKKRSKQNRYSSEITNIAISLYSRTKCGYDDLKKEMPVALPSSRNIEQCLEPLRFKDGPQPISLAMLHEFNQNTQGKILGHLMMDEIKLKNGIMWNCKNNSVTDYIPDQLDT